MEDTLSDYSSPIPSVLCSHILDFKARYEYRNEICLEHLSSGCLFTKHVQSAGVLGQTKPDSDDDKVTREEDGGRRRKEDALHKKGVYVGKTKSIVRVKE